MTTVTELSERRSTKYAWKILFIISLLQSLNNIYLVFYLDNPIMGLGLLGCSLFATVIAYFPFRQGEKWAWVSMWLFFGVLALITLLEAMGEEPWLGWYYGVFTAVTLLALLLTIRDFFPKEA